MAKKDERPMSWPDRIVEAILRRDIEGGQDDEKASFDLDTDDRQYPTIHWLIARYMLEGLPEYRIVDKLREDQGMVSRYLDMAIAKLMEGGRPVYKIIEKGGQGRNICCVTLRPNYKDAKAATFQRRQQLADRSVIRAMDHIAIATGDSQALAAARAHVRQSLDDAYTEALCKMRQLTSAPTSSELPPGEPIIPEIVDAVSF